MSRRKKAGIVCFCVLAVGLAVWLDQTQAAKEKPRESRSKASIGADDFEKYHGKIFRVIHVVDGDTLDIDIPDSDKHYTRIRLLGIDTPETKNTNQADYFGPEAEKAAFNLTTDKNVCVYLDTEENTRGYYGRLLAYVKLPDNRFLNEVLISEGFGYADLRFRHSLYNRYTQLEASARSLKKGLWAEVMREQLPEWLQKKKPKLLLKK
ncbi:MAG: thermonuclease family protein [Sedimentisphaerales bacterium]|nr:thermonuclease family protein [Sedimentisphaerales bacterium]